MRTAFDGIAADYNVIRANLVKGEITFAYIDGRYAWSSQQIADLEGAGVQVIYITVEGDPAAGVYDFERGNGGTARGYARARRALNYDPTIYCNLSTLPAVRKQCAGLAYDVIAADPTGEPHEIPGTVGTQYLWTQDYDLTAIYDDNWHRA